MRNLLTCENCGGWREKYRRCDGCGQMSESDFAPKPEQLEPEGNSRSLRRMLKNKRRK